LSNADLKDVTVIILTRNNASTIGPCLESVVREGPGEIIAVDSQSSDGTLSIFARYAVRVIQASRNNIGFKRQLGVNAAKGDYVMFVDSDAVLVAGCINRMLHELERFNYTGVHARVLSMENVSYWQRVIDRDFIEHYQVGPATRIDSMAALFKKDALLKFPFDPYCHGAEDLDLSRRLIAANLTLGVSAACVYHLHRREFSAWVRQRYRNGEADARIDLRNGEHDALLWSLPIAFMMAMHELARRRLSFIPYRLVNGVAVFAGVLAGYSKLRKNTNYTQ
jgi:glycosyltransferase involved in cell wall biosynthesis